MRTGYLGWNHLERWLLVLLAAGGLNHQARATDLDSMLRGAWFVERQVLGFKVRLVATPPPGATNYLVKERPPFGAVANISHGGAYDPATRTLVFGPFNDNLPRTLTYEDSPPLGDQGRYFFTGEAVANGTSSAIAGDDYLEIPSFPPQGFRVLPRWRPLSQQTVLQLVRGSGEPCFVWASTNLLDWEMAGELRSVFDGFEWVDAAAPNHPRRFYRAQTIPPPVQQPQLLGAWAYQGYDAQGSLVVTGRLSFTTNVDQLAGTWEFQSLQSPRQTAHYLGQGAFAQIRWSGTAVTIDLTPPGMIDNSFGLVGDLGTNTYSGQWHWDGEGPSQSGSFTAQRAPPPTLAVQPSLTNFVGGIVTLTVTATGTPPLSYQWQKDGADLNGQTNRVLCLTLGQLADAGRYRVVVFTSGGRIESDEAVLRVLPAPTEPGCAGSLDLAFDADHCTWPRSWWHAFTEVTVQSDGKVVLSGGDEEGCSGVIRLNADGSLDTNAMTDPPAFRSRTTAVQPDGRSLRIVVEDEYHAHLARFLPDDSTLDAGFVADLPPGFVPTLIAVQPHGRILVAGRVYDQAAERFLDPTILRLHPDGLRDATFAAPITFGLSPGEGTEAPLGPRDLLAQNDGKFYVGGFFTAVNGVRRTDVARFLADGSLDPSFDPDIVIRTWADLELVETVTAMALGPDGNLVLAGFFETINGFDRNGVVRLHTTTDSCAGVITFAERDTIANEASGMANVVVRRLGGTNQAVSVSCATYTNDHVSLGTPTAGVDYLPRQHTLEFAPGETVKTFSVPLLDDPEREANEWIPIALSNPSPGVALRTPRDAAIVILDDENLGRPGSVDDAFSANLDGAVLSIAPLPDGAVFVAGEFTAADGVPRTGLARLNADGSLDPGFDAAVDGSIHALAAVPTTRQLIIGGEFTQVNGQGQSYLARLNADGSLDSTFAVNVSDTVRHLALQPDGKLIIYGEFNLVNGTARPGFARLQRDGTLDLAFHVCPEARPHLAHDVHAITLQPDGKLLVGGYLGNVCGHGTEDLWRLNADGSVDTNFSFHSGYPISWAEGIAVQPDGKIVVAGYFSSLSGSVFHSPLRLNPDGSLDAAFATNRLYGRSVFVQPDGKILVGGLQRLNSDGTVDPTFFAGSGATDVYAAALLPDGDVLIGGYFYYVNELRHPFLARLNGDGTPPFVARHIDSFNFTVELAAVPPAAVTVYLVEEQVPAPFWPIHISHGGVFDPINRLIRFGPFPDHAARALSYVVQIPDGDCERPKVITGQATADGAVTPIVGDVLFGPRELFPADRSPTDGWVSSDEVAVFSAAWRQGQSWPLGPSPVSLDYVARAAALWQGNDAYYFDPQTIPNPPTLRWLSFGAPFPACVRYPSPLPAGTVERQLPATFVPAQPLTVLLTVSPAGNVTACTLEDQPPAGWAISHISDGGAVDAHSGKIKLGPFLGSQVRTLSYRVTPPSGAQGNGTFAGVVSFEGVTGAIVGAGVVRSSGASEPPAITIQPISQTNLIGRTVVFDVQVTGTPLMSFQWLFNGNPIGSEGDWSGSALVLTNLQPVDAGRYWVVVSNSFGSVTSAVATLTVWPPPVHPGAFDPSFLARLDNQCDSIYAMVKQADGKLILGGGFSGINGVPRLGVARLNLEGSVDSTFDARLNAGVEALALQADGKVVVGGSFSQVNGVPRQGLAQLHTDGTLDLSFAPSLRAFAWVSAVATQPDGKVLAAVEGLTDDHKLAHLLRFLPDGRIDSGFPLPVSDASDGSIEAIVLQPDGKILVGGSFQTIAGSTRRGIARLNGNGSLDVSFDPGAGVSGIAGLVLQPDGRIVIGGGFDAVNEVPRHGLARLMPNGSVDSGFVAEVSCCLSAVALQADGKILVGGGFREVGGVARNGVARLHPDGSVDLAFDTGSGISPIDDSSVMAIVAQDDGSIVIAGTVFVAYDGFPCVGLARLHGGSAVPSPTITGQPVSQTVAEGITVNFSVSATGSPPLSYQWQKDEANLEGRTNATLTLAAVRPSDTGKYRVIVSNAAGSVASAEAKLIVLPGTLGPAAVLNEVLANNQSLTNAEGRITDWVELVNLTAQALDLADCSLTDDPANPRRWIFPMGTVLPPHGFLVVHCDGGSPPSINPVLNTGFGFNPNGGRIYLFNRLLNGGTVMASLVFGLQAADFSLGRVPDATGAWTLCRPTPAAPNVAASLGSISAIRLNEWMSHPQTDDSDWFELYNPLPQPVALGGSYLTDNLDNRTQYPIPPYSYLGFGRGGFVVFYADHNVAAGADHTGFRLGNGGGDIGLFSATGEAIDTATYGAQPEGISEGCLPDGGTTIVQFPGSATPGASNRLLIAERPSITQQPAGQTVAEGGTVSFTVTATGTPPLSCQWYRDSYAIVGATNATLVFSPVNPGQAGYYSVAVRNAAGTVYSQRVMLTVVDARQAWAWINQGGGSSHDSGRSLVEDHQGNLLALGYCTPPMILGATPIDLPDGVTVPFLAKHDSSGSLVWVRTWGTGRAGADTLEVDAADNVYVSGFFDAELTIGDTTLTSGTSYGSVYLAKFDANGNPLWATAAHTANDDPWTCYATVDPTGRAYLLGYFYGEARFGALTLTNTKVFGGCDLFVASYDPEGNVAWAMRGETSGRMYPHGLVKHPQGGICVLGDLSGAGALGPVSLTPAGEEDLFLARITEAGEVRWIQQAGGSDSWHWIVPPATDADGNVYLAGGFVGEVSFGTNTLRATSILGTRYGRCFLAKYDAAGHLAWAQQSRGDDSQKPEGLAVSPEGHAYFCGWFCSNITFGGHQLVGTSSDNGFLFKCDSGGNVLWDAAIIGAGSRKIILDGSGQVHLSGAFSRPSIVVGGQEIIAWGGHGFWIADYAADGNPQRVRTAGGTRNLNLYALVSDELGNLYGTGDFDDVVAFGPHILASRGSGDFFLARLNTE
jgi:uncharacterized delta-60 repeat protein